MNVLFWGRCDFPISSRAGIFQGTFEIVSKEVLWSVRGSYLTIWGPPLSNVTGHSGWWPQTVTPFIDKTLHQFWQLLIWTLSPNLTFYLIVQGFHRTYATGAASQQKDAYSSGHLVLSHFGTCMCSNVETNLSWTCPVSELLNFEHPSVLLFAFALLLVCLVLGCRHSFSALAIISHFSQVDCTFSNILTCVHLPVGDVFGVYF